MQKKSPVRTLKKLSPDAKKELVRYNFPGNVRELEHIIERAIIFSEGDTIHPKDISVPKEDFDFTNFTKEDGTIMTMDEVEKIHIKHALDQHNWNRENTARALDISQKTLYSKILKYNLK